MSAPLQVHRRGPVDHLVLDAPASRNSLSIAAMQAMIEAIRSSTGRGSRALVLDHAGKVFCAGVDLKERLARPGEPHVHSELLGRLLVELWNYPSPVICRVAGRVRGGGMGLLACSDFVVASPAADFAFSEVRVGVAPAIVGNFSLQGIPSRALRPFLLTGETFGAAQALALGLITRVAGDDDASIEPEVAAVLQGAPASQQLTKRLARELGGENPMAAHERMQRLSGELFGSAEAAEGMQAFRERRKAAWVRNTQDAE